MGHVAPKGTNPIGVVHKSGRLACHYVEKHGFTCLIEIARETEKVVVVEPRSENIVTPEGIGFGNHLQEAITAGGILDSVSREVRLPSGWIAESSHADRDTPCEDQLDKPISDFSAYDQAWLEEESR